MFMNPKTPHKSVGNPEAIAWFSHSYRVRISPAQATPALGWPTPPRSLTPNLSSHTHHTLASSGCALGTTGAAGGGDNPWRLESAMESPGELSH